ncbi:MAG: hypothetical protein BHV97_01895 [Clostridium sp. CAG:349_48_7]|nr:MAG: hypothetical protein BHV97_01895 [Clostridium sp. CAG:349_48_7]
MQVISSKKLQARAAEQWYRDLPLVARRGGIYDRNGITLADTATRYTIYVRPNAVENPKEVAAALSEYAGADYQKILDANGLKESDTLAPGTVIKIPQ